MKIWDFTSSKEKEITMEDNILTCIIDNYSNKLIAASKKGFLFIWNISNNIETLTNFVGFKTYGQKIKQLVVPKTSKLFHPKVIVINSEDDIEIWDVESQVCCSRILFKYKF